MANNVFQVKRTNVSGRTPNTTGSYVTNSQYIAAGEFALNMADGILYTSNGSAPITVGANQVNQSVTNTLTVASTTTVNSTGVTTTGFVNATGVVSGLELTSTLASGDEGGQINLTKPPNGTTNGNVIIDAYQNRIRIYEAGSPNRGAYIDLTAAANGVASNLLTGGGGGGGTVTSVGSGDGLTGGPITGSGTLSVLANNGISVNSSGVFAVSGLGTVVNSTGINVNANNGLTATAAGVFVTGNSGLIVNSTGVHVLANNGIIANSTGTFVNWGAPSVIGGTTANGASFTYANISGQVNTATLYAATSANIASSILANSSGFYPTSNTVGFNLGNTTARWSLVGSTGTFNSTLSVGGGTTLSSTVTFGGTGININAVALTTGSLNFGGPTQTGSILLGQSTNNQTVSIANGATISGNVKTISIGENGVAGSQTNITVGSSLSNTLVTVNANNTIFSGIVNVGNSSVNVSINSTAFSGTANNASFLGGVAAASYVNTSGNYTLSGNLNFTAGANSIALTNGVSNWIYWAGAGYEVPTFTTRSTGTKLVLYPALSGSQTDYAIGIDGGVLWSSVPVSNSTYSFKWYGGVTEIASLSATGNLLLAGSVNAASHTVGSVFIANSTQLTTTVPFSANGGTGTAGQVLTSNGSTGSPYWSTASGGSSNSVYMKGGAATIGTLASEGTNIFRVNANTLNYNTTFVAGENAQATGPITVASGITLAVEEGARVSIV